MSGRADATTPPCGCSAFSFPTEPCNPAGLPVISYRTGDFVSFRYQLLEPLPGETELTTWRPGATGDLAVQLMEWWAYLGDILTFYNERITNEAYLGTAILPESVNHLVQLLGYRPKPALGAKGMLAALLTPSARPPVTLPPGLQIQSKPGPGQQPQIFEVDQATTIGVPDQVIADVVPNNRPLFDTSGSILWLAGKVTTIKPNDRYLLINAAAISTQTIQDYAWIKVSGTTPGSDPLGNTVTKVSFQTIGSPISASAQAANYVLLKAQQSGPLWSYPKPLNVITSTSASAGATTAIDLAGIARGVTAGSLVMIEVADTAATTAALAACVVAVIGFDLAAIVAGLGGPSPQQQQAADAATGATAVAVAVLTQATGSATAANALLTAAAQALQTGPAAVAALTAAVAGAMTADNVTVAAAVAAEQQGASPAAMNAAVTAAKLATAATMQPGGTTLLAASQAAYTAATAVGDSALAAGAAATAAAVEAAADGLTPTPAIVQSYAEIVWYANGDGTNFTNPGTAANPIPAIPIPHAHIVLATGLTGSGWAYAAPQVTVRWVWSSVGQIVPVNQPSDFIYPYGGTALVASPSSPNPFPVAATPVPVLLEDANVVGAATGLSATGDPPIVNLGTLTPDPQNGLASPIDVFFDLVGVSRGKTVPAEILGGGNPSVAGQDFTLSQSPVTYFFDPASVSGPNFSSTVTVSVNGVAWQEVRSFYGQPANAQIFTLHEDDQGQTHVSFGDGVNGALLPTGTNNVTATYRFGAGAAAPPAETLTVVLTPTPGLKGVRNPLPPTGGGDPDQPSQLRTLAPRSVLTFNRAVSLDDYAAIALTASGVTQATASYAFDAQSQRPVVVLWIIGDSNAATAAGAALAGTEMPNQRLVIQQAVPVTSVLTLTYIRDPRYADAAVSTGLMAALADPVTGLFAPANVGIGRPIYQSQIDMVCLKVPGVTAIQNVTLNPATSTGPRPRFRRFIFRPFPGIGSGGAAPQSFSPGPGAYFQVPNDPAHVQLNGTIAS